MLLICIKVCAKKITNRRGTHRTIKIHKVSKDKFFEDIKIHRSANTLHY